ncbi:MAG: transcription termination/antitermination NusG family protein, partial [Anaerolineales bacterium]|nr:transcription termination/antitermination NusG family protein [Anaerolineales bacterium]
MAEYWYVLRTKPKKELFVYQQLLAREVALYFPSMRVKPVNPRAAKVRPFFPGYLFVQADLDVDGYNAFNWLPGTVGLI